VSSDQSLLLSWWSSFSIFNLYFQEKTKENNYFQEKNKTFAIISSIHISTLRYSTLSNFARVFGVDNILLFLIHHLLLLLLFLSLFYFNKLRYLQLSQ